MKRYLLRLDNAWIDSNSRVLKNQINLRNWGKDEFWFVIVVFVGDQTKLKQKCEKAI